MPTGLDEKDTGIFHGGEAARSTAVEFRGRVWQTRQKIGISVGAAHAILEGVVERGEKHEPAPDSRIVVSHFADTFERFVIREYTKLCAPEVTSKLFDDSENPASFQVERSPVSLRVEGSAADVTDRMH